MGQTIPLSQRHCNIFTHTQDPYVVDKTTKTLKSLYPGQKPISLKNELIHLYTNDGDWIYSSPSGIGQHMHTHTLILQN